MTFYFREKNNDAYLCIPTALNKKTISDVQMIWITNTIPKGAYLEYRNPGVSNIIEVHCPFVRVELPGLTLTVKQVPVNTAAVACPIQARVGMCRWRCALNTLLGGGHLTTAQHAVLLIGGADEGVVLTFFIHVVRTHV